MPRYPRKSGKCEITGCKNTPTDWHHVISQAQIKKRGLPKSYFTDPGNLKEYCREHHDMTTASLTRKYLENKENKDKSKPKKRKVTCGRCGRVGHIRTNCKLKTTVDGVRITTKSWKYRPKAKPKAKPKPKKKSRKKPDYGVICARCNRQGHESKDCRAKTKVSPSGPLADILRKGLPKR